MNYKNVGILIGVVALSCKSIIGSPFENLNFEAVVEPLPPPSIDNPWVPIGVGLPGWSAYLGTVETTEVLNNLLPLANSAHVAIYQVDQWPGFVLGGRYSIVLQSGFLDGDQIVDASISQVGEIPEDARWISLRASAAGPFGVFLNESEIDLASSLSGSDGTLYLGDVSAYAGQSVELSIRAIDQTLDPQFPRNTFLLLDDIQFSSVPEPSTCALFALAAGIGWLCRNRMLQ